MTSARRPAGEPLRIAFAGTPEFALAALDALAASHHRLAGVWTQPDRPAGRGRKLSSSPVKTRARQLGLPIYQPVSLRNPQAQQALAELQPDLMVVVAYGLLLPAKVLATPPLGCLNIHASLLPRWRGAAPIQRAILAGDVETGVSIMQMDKGLDTGDVLLQRRTPIHTEDTAQSLHDRLAKLGGDALLQVLEDLQALPRQQQDEAAASYAAKLTKEEAHLDWTRPAEQLERCVRAYNPWPVAYTLYQGSPLRIYDAAVLPDAAAAPAGVVVAAGREGIDVASGDGLLRIRQLQAAGGRVMPAGDFANARGLVGLQLQ
jgi:methionyl-tRNA formyltransferase